MPRLADLPSGSRVLIDANIVVYAAQSEATFGATCNGLLDRVARKDVSAAISLGAVIEALHRLMIHEAAALHGFPPQGALRRLQKQPELIKPLTTHTRIVEWLQRLQVDIVTVELRHITSSHRLRQTHGLLVNDSILLAVMLEHGLTDLVTQDVDFDNVPGLTIWKPVV